MTTSAYILEGTADNFDQLVIDNSRKGLVLVDFWAPWVGPSLRQQEILRELAITFEGRFLLVSVNTDEQKALVASILSEYDAENLTAEDAKAINNAFREAGIRRGPGQQEAIEAAGFDPGKISSLDPPPGAGGGIRPGRPRHGPGRMGHAPEPGGLHPGRPPGAGPPGRESSPPG